jgi:hypothetical protein
MSGHVHVLQRLRELQCAWDSVEVCSLAAVDGLVPVLQWAKQHGAVFTEITMIHAAGNGRTAVCEYLHAQQCPFDAVACTAAADTCNVDTLNWLLEHGYPYIELWRVAATQGHIAVLIYLQQIALAASPEELTVALFIAGVQRQPAAAQWLRAYGVEWPAVLSAPVRGEMKQWEGAILEWARAEGYTSPLQL